MAVRDEDQTTEALALLRGEGLTNIHFLELDLINPRFAKDAAERYITMEERLDILGKFFTLHAQGELIRTTLVNNAALYAGSMSRWLAAA